MIPEIDNLIGISVYSTKSSGSGGRIKSSQDQFFVSEVIKEKVLESISQSGTYTVYKLKKTGIDTNHALSDIFKKQGLRLKALGLKDANATTEQYVCDTSTGKAVQNIITNKYVLEKIGHVKKPLTKKDMIGNHFKIKIEDADFNKINNFSEYDKIINFYGYQRFGSKRPVSHIIGKAIIQRNFDFAVEALLSHTSKYDSPENSKIRESLKNESEYAKVLNDIPYSMDIERIVVKEMIEHGDSLKSLRAIPIQLRRFFVEAFQSHIFNRSMSMVLENGHEVTKPQQGDVCFDANDNLGRFENDPKQRLAIPLVGYSYSKKNRFDNEISKVLDFEQVKAKDFFIKEMQEANEEGGFRQAVISCKDFSSSEPYVSFTLSRGSYATILLREVMKPTDPVASGF